MIERSTSSALLAIVLLTLLAARCGGGGEAESTAPPPRAGAAPPVMGSVELGETTYEFRVTACDLTGTAEDGIFLKGTGTMPDGTQLMPDGRMLLVEVERLRPDPGGVGMTAERATVQFGGFMEKDGWEAAANNIEGGLPIIKVSGNQLVVAATYKHASRDERVEGTLRVTCPAPTYP